MNLRLPLIPMILALVVTLFTSTSLFAFDSEEDLRLLEKARKSEASGAYSRASNFYAEYLRKIEMIWKLGIPLISSAEFNNSRSAFKMNNTEKSWSLFALAK